MSSTYNNKYINKPYESFLKYTTIIVTSKVTISMYKSIEPFTPLPCWLL